MNGGPSDREYSLEQEVVTLRRERDALRESVAELGEAVIMHGNRWRTLLDIYESEDWRALCVECQEPDCPGCPPVPDPPDRETWEVR